MFAALLVAALALLQPGWRSYVEQYCPRIEEQPLPAGLPAHAYAAALPDGTCVIAPHQAERLGPVGLASILVHEAAHQQLRAESAAVGIQPVGRLAELSAERVQAAAASQHGWVHTPRDVRALPDSRLPDAGYRTINVTVRD